MVAEVVVVFVLYGLAFVFIGRGLEVAVSDDVFAVAAAAALASCCVGAAVHMLADAATAADEGREGEALGRVTECARKAARKFAKNGRCVGML